MNKCLKECPNPTKLDFSTNICGPCYEDCAEMQCLSGSSLGTNNND